MHESVILNVEYINCHTERRSSDRFSAQQYAGLIADFFGWGPIRSSNYHKNVRLHRLLLHQNRQDGTTSTLSSFLSCAHKANYATMISRTTLALVLTLVVVVFTAMAEAKNESKKRHLIQEKIGNVRKVNRKRSERQLKDEKSDFILRMIQDFPEEDLLEQTRTNQDSPMTTRNSAKITANHAHGYQRNRKLGKSSKKGSNTEEAPALDRSDDLIDQGFIDVTDGNFTDSNSTDSDDGFFNFTDVEDGIFNFTGSNVTESDDGVFNFTDVDVSNSTDPGDVSNETEVPIGETNTTTILIKLAENNSTCVMYNGTLLEIVDCDDAGYLGEWEIIESEDPLLMQLRHTASGLCLPENPEFPKSAFECWIQEVDQAIADTINGLVDCSSPYAAFVGFTDADNPSLFYNAVCSTGEVGADTDVILMSYTPSGGATQLLWGEKALLELTAGGPFELEAGFVFDFV
jgi:hypothetical protein